VRLQIAKGRQQAGKTASFGIPGAKSALAFQQVEHIGLCRALKLSFGHDP
jgi:hypothetical protein